MSGTVPVSIRLARKTDLRVYTDLFQKTYQNAYVNKRLGLTRECFSKSVFASDEWQDYLRDLLKQSSSQKTLLAFIGPKLVGSVTMTKTGKERELRGFYVAPNMQGKGVGTVLYKKALAFAKGRDVFLEVYSHARRTISMYKRWGFSVDRKRGVVRSHWSEWPEGVVAKRIFMRLPVTAARRTRS